MPSPVNHASLTAHEKELLAAVRHPSVLTPDLRKKQYRGDPMPIRGHCYVASEALCHLLGAPVSKWKMGRLTLAPQLYGYPKVSGTETHYFCLHAELLLVIDPTWDQYDKPLPYNRARPVAPLTGWKKPSKACAIVLERVKTILAEGKSLNMDDARYINEKVQLRSLAEDGRS